MRYLYSAFPAIIFSAGIVAFISTNQPVNLVNSINQNEGTSIHGLAEYNLMRLRDPQTGKIPTGIREKELAFASELPGFVSPILKQNNASSLELPSLTWKSRGPWNLGGRTRAFALDVTNENILIAGAASGGMWRSTNSGASWTMTTGIQQHRSITCLAQDKRVGKTNTWYAGSGEAYGASASASGAYYLGNGLYKSIDGGQTWTSLTSTQSGTPQSFDNVWDVIWNVATNPADTVNNVVYAACYGVVYKSMNGGTTWTLARGSTATYSYFTDVAVTPSGVVYVTLSSDGAQKGIWRSVNGTTWTNITPAGFPSVYGRTVIGVSPSDENQVYFLPTATTGFGTPDTNFLGDVEWNSLWKFTYDSSGGKWYDLSANLPTTGGPFDKFTVQGGYDAIVRVHPADTAVVFLGGTNLYRSNSGFFNSGATTFIGGYEQGATLPLVNMYANHHPDQHEIAFLPSNPNTMFCANDGGIFKTTDNMNSTVTWSPLNYGYLTSMFYTVAIDHASPGDSTIIGGTQDNGSWFVNSNNPQAQWVTPRGGDGSYCAIADNKSKYYFSIQNGKMMRANVDAAGNKINYARIDPIGGTGYLFINPYILDPNNNDIMYLAGGKNLWRNDNLSGIPMINNWDSISTNWVKLPDTVPTANAKITAVAASKTPGNIVYYGTSNRRVYRLDNANIGTPTPVDISWTASNGFPSGGNVSCIAVDPKDAGNVIVAFSNYSVYSLFYSTNADTTGGAPTWTKIGGNLEATVAGTNLNGTGNGPSVRWVSILPVSDGTVYLVATSTGLYATDTLPPPSSTISPVVWTQQAGSEIGNSVCDMIDVRLTDGLVVVGTHSHGVFTTNITSKSSVTSAGNFNSSAFNLSIYPNPFSSSATIQFTLNKPAKANMNIFDLNGNVVKSFEEKYFIAGNHQINFSDHNMPSGVYYFIMRSEEATETRKIIHIK